MATLPAMTDPIDWKARALAAEAALAERVVGRPAGKSKHPDALLVAALCKRFAMTRQELGLKLGVDPSNFAPTHLPFPPVVRARVEAAMLEEPTGERPKVPKKKKKRA